MFRSSQHRRRDDNGRTNSAAIRREPRCLRAFGRRNPSAWRYARRRASNARRMKPPSLAFGAWSGFNSSGERQKCSSRSMVPWAVFFVESKRPRGPFYGRFLSLPIAGSGIRLPLRGTSRNLGNSVWSLPDGMVSANGGPAGFWTEASNPDASPSSGRIDYGA